ncbi:cytochrome-c peroxidase [Parabacteroides bouchesdurhonensis]|uniref:cytochrome-c peroxidase n=1 Tax=Parabacteroides bouchesdurhonensis TaxID=1936995 RepID=UPI000E4D9A6B|nr:cytochrome c peroxidase [Parabacteroides bouchesdurhonensis]RHJ91693.1 cytochrome B6 [Bacteroides sp. AM07-16]
MRFVILSVYVVLAFASCSQEQKEALNEKELLGKAIFFDENLSEPAGVSCVTCHTPEAGFADKYSRVTSEGAVKGLFSNRNSMTCAYSAYVPALYYNEEDETYVGGLFWDGRVNTLEEQSVQPFVNPLEMANKDFYRVVEKVKAASYYPQFIKVYGASLSDDSIHACINDAIATYERSEEMSPFTSKFDAWLEGRCQFTEKERAGYELFKDKGLCAECHILDKDERAGRVLFTDHTYDNLGIPSNPENPFFQLSAPYNTLGRDTFDLGLGAVLKDSAHYGKFRVPTLRNIALTAPYGHNGYFKTLEEIVHFYNVRDVEEFPIAEYPETVNKDELGNLGLTPEEEAAIVAFMETLTDGYSTD